jgi:hypothetical protein
MVRGPGGRTLNCHEVPALCKHRLAPDLAISSLPITTRCIPPEMLLSGPAPCFEAANLTHLFHQSPGDYCGGIAAMVEGVSCTLPGTCLKSGERTLSLCSHLRKLHPRARSKVPCRSAVSITAAAGSCRHARGPKKWHGRAPLT